MRVVRVLVDLQMAEHRLAQRPAREHPPDRLLEDAFRVLRQLLLVRTRLKPARVAGVGVVLDLRGLPARDPYL